MTDQAALTYVELERLVLNIIALGRARCGAGFGKYPLGIKDAVDELMPKMVQSAKARAAYADFMERLNR